MAASRYVSKAIYTILGLNIEGKKELLGLYLSDRESAHHWLSVLTNLHNRGVKDILIGLCGRPQGLPRSHQEHLPRHRDPALRHPPDPQLDEVHRRQEPESLHDRSRVRVQGRHAQCCRDCAGRVGGEMGRKYPLVIAS